MTSAFPTAVEVSDASVETEPFIALPHGLDRADDENVRRVVVWGTGVCAQQLLSCMRPRMEIVAFIDKRPETWGTTVAGVQVHGPADLAGIDYDRLVVASGAAAEIRRDLAALGHLDHRVREFTELGDSWRLAPVVTRAVFGTLQVGITTRCNLMCAHCPRVTDSSIYSDLPLEAFREYLSRFDPSQFSTLLVSDFGEVTIVKSLLSYLRAAHEMGWRDVQFVTNGTNGRPELWETIFSEELAKEVIVSLEGIGPAFEEVRGFPWARFAANVRTIADANARHGRQARLVFNAVAMRSNLEGLPDVVDFAAEHHAKLVFVNLNPSSEFNNPLGRSENRLDQAPRADVVRVFGEVLRRAAVLGVPTLPPEDFPELQAEAATPLPELPAVHPIDQLRCRQPLSWVEAGGDGGVFPCCQMAKRQPMGNLRTHSFAQIWNGAEYRRLFDGLKPGGTPIEVCRTCNIYNGKRF